MQPAGAKESRAVQGHGLRWKGRDAGSGAGRARMQAKGWASSLVEEVH